MTFVNLHTPLFPSGGPPRCLALPETGAGITPAAVCTFMRRTLSTLHAEVLVHGNATAAEVNREHLVHLHYIGVAFPRASASRRYQPRFPMRNTPGLSCWQPSPHISFKYTRCDMPRTELCTHAFRHLARTFSLALALAGTLPESSRWHGRTQMHRDRQCAPQPVRCRSRRFPRA